MFCEFCAIELKKHLKVSKSFEYCDRREEYLNIFRQDLVAFAFPTTGGGCNCCCCEKCLKMLQQCFSFVQQMLKTQQQLKLPREKPQELERANVQRKILPKPLSHEQEQESVGITSPVTQPVSTKKRERSYKCPECTSVFSCHRQLKAHEKATHISNDSNCSICPYCFALFANAETLAKHQSDAHQDGRFLCAPCNKHYKSKGHLRKHTVKAHAKSGAPLLFYCTLCPTTTSSSTGRNDSHVQKYLSRTALQQHFEAVHLLMPSTREDDDVDIEMNEEFLDEFLLSANTNENSFQFSECWDALDLHLTDMLHEPVAAAARNDTTAAFICPKCGGECTDQKSLMLHLAHKHALPMLICLKCEGSFRDASALAEHKATPHCGGAAQSSAAERKCAKCEKTFKSDAALNYHRSTHEKRPPHNCPFCGKDFSGAINLKQHLRIVHSLQKRHTCLLCDKQFATLDHLKKHVLAQHQNERRHICEVCAKGFTQLGHLKQHLAIHTHGKTLQCEVCDASFWRKIDLKRHKLSKHA